jgi:hypothetical protein
VATACAKKRCSVCEKKTRDDMYRICVILRHSCLVGLSPKLSRRSALFSVFCVITKQFSDMGVYSAFILFKSTPSLREFFVWGHFMQLNIYNISSVCVNVS